MSFQQQNYSKFLSWLFKVEAKHVPLLNTGSQQSDNGSEVTNIIKNKASFYMFLVCISSTIDPLLMIISFSYTALILGYLPRLWFIQA